MSLHVHQTARASRKHVQQTAAGHAQRGVIRMVAAVCWCLLQAIFQDSYAFSSAAGCEQYTAPPEGAIESYTDFIRSLPDTAPPEVRCTGACPPPGTTFFLSNHCGIQPSQPHTHSSEWLQSHTRTTAPGTRCQTSNCTVVVPSALLHHHIPAPALML
jgi:hypothetical protein